MKLSCMVLVYHICGYHYNCPKSADIWYQYQKDKQDNNNLPIVVRKAILPIYQSLCKSEMLDKCLHGKTQNANESFNGMIWNRMLNVAHVGLDVLAVSVYDSIAHFNNGEKTVLNIMELLKVDPGYYITKSCRSVNMRRKRSSIYRMSEPQKNVGRYRIIQKKQQDKNIETVRTSYE